MPFISFQNVINQIQALIILHPLIIMVILTNKGPDLAAPTAVSWEGRWSPTEIVESNTKHNA